MKSLRSWTLRSFVVVSLSLAIVVAALCATTTAFAQGKAEGSSRALQKKAMEEDYLATDFAKAQEKLEKAIADCGTTNCSPGLRSRLKRDLGVVLIGGGIDKEKGLASFVEALRLDPSVALEPDVKTKELEQVFADAKKRAASGLPVGGPRLGASGQPQGDFTHTPAAEQTVRTAIPVYAEYDGPETLVKVIARYKGFGMMEWKSAELKKMGEKGWGGVIPCPDVQQGTTQYYIQGFDANNDPVATSGDRNTPYRVPVTKEKVADPPHLPGAPPPTQCADEGDCPPGFPCKKPAGGAAADSSQVYTVLKDTDAFCEEDSECKSGRCQNDKCTAPPEVVKKRPKFWFGVAGAFDYSFVPSAEDVCKVHPKDFADTNRVPTPVNDQNYYCMRGSADYPSRTASAENESIVLSKNRGSDKVTGGGAFGNVRVMLTADYALTPNWLLGARLGLVLNSYPGKEAGVDGSHFAAPIHFELRATYILGKDALYNKGIAPYFFAGVGVGQFETKIPVQVIEEPPGGEPQRRDVDAWHLSGPAFFSLGLGGRYAISSRLGIMLGLRGNFAFGYTFAPSLGPELGVQVGF